MLHWRESEVLLCMVPSAELNSIRYPRFTRTSPRSSPREHENDNPLGFYHSLQNICFLVREDFADKNPKLNLLLLLLPDEILFLRESFVQACNKIIYLVFISLYLLIFKGIRCNSL
jgi:hypothetical protein